MNKQDEEIFDQQPHQDVVNASERAIRNHFSMMILRMMIFPPFKNRSHGKFMQKVAETKTLIEEDQDQSNFVIKDVDAILL